MAILCKTMTIALPSEIHCALLELQFKMAKESPDLKKPAMRYIIAEALSKQLGIELPEGWNKEDIEREKKIEKEKYKKKVMLKEKKKGK